MHTLPFALPALVGAGCVLVLGVAAFLSSSRASARIFTVFCLSVFVWCCGAAAEQLSHTLAAQVFWSKVEHIGVAFVGLTWFAFCGAYTGSLRWPYRHLWPLALIPLVSLGLVWTNEAHGLIWSQVRWTGADSDFTHGWWFSYVYLPYGYLLIGLGSLRLWRSYASATASYRRSLLDLMLSSSVPLVMNALYLTNVSRIPLDLTPTGFALSAVLVAWALFRDDFLRREPVSLRQLLRQLPDAVMVLGREGLVLETNLAAAGLFGDHLNGQSLAQRVPDLLPYLSTPDETSAEQVYSRGGRSYRVQLEPMLQGGEGPVTQLLTLRDVSEYVQATARLEQQAAFQGALLGGMHTLLGAETGPQVYQLFLEQAMRVIPGAEAGSVVLQQPDGRFGYVASVGFDLPTLQQVMFDRDELFYRDHLQGGPSLITGVDAFNARALPPEKTALIRQAGCGVQYQASLALPVFLGGELLAVLSLDNASSPQAFGPEVRRLAEVFAQHIGVALQKARFKGQLEDAVRAQTLLADVEKLLLETTDLQRFFPLLADALLETEGVGVDQLVIYERHAHKLEAHVYSQDAQRQETLLRELAGAGLLRHSGSGNDLLSRCVEDRAPLYLADVWEVNDWIRLESNPARTVFFCPLLHHREVWGVLEFSSDVPHAFGEATRELLMGITQSTELALAREYDRRRLELELSRMNGVVSSAEAMRALATPQQVFEEAVRAALGRTQADLCALFWYDPEADSLELQAGLLASEDALTPLPPYTLRRDSSLSWQVMRENATLLIADGPFMSGYARDKGQPWEPRAYVGTPLHDGVNRPTGVLVALKQGEGTGFETGDVAFLEAMAQATSAATIRLELLGEAENRASAYEQLYRTAARQHQELALLDRVRTALAREIDLLRVAQTLVAALSDAAFSDTAAYAAVRVYWLEEETLVLREQAGRGAVSGDAAARRAVLDKAVAEGQPVLSEIPGTAGEKSTWKIAVPLYGHEKILGVLSAESHAETPFEESNLKLLTALSEQVSIALERALLYGYIRESETRLRLLAENMSDMVCLHAPDGRLVYVSPSSQTVLGLPPETLLGEPLTAHLHPRDAATLTEHFAHGFLTGNKALFFRLRGADGVYRHFETVIQPLYAEAGALRGFTSSSRDVTERRAMEEQLRHAAHFDSLTQLPNRSLFLERLEGALGAQHPGSQTAVLFIDLDRFKMVNDSLGHQAGDALLKQLSTRLLVHVRPDDTVARLSGDEFCVLLKDLTAEAVALQIVERLQRAVAAPFVLEGRECFVSASIGIAFATGTLPAAELLRNADIAMYRAKHGGRDAHVVFDPSMHQEAMARLTLEGNLRHALEHHTLALHYQPIFNLQTGALTGFEALCRWQLGDKLVPPDTFIPIAEETGLITRLDAWAVREACRQLVSWQRTFDLPTSVGVSVNLASRSFEQPELPELLARALLETGLSASCLTVELTERTVMRDDAAGIKVLQALRGLGVRVQVDDFGTGYSSLRYLHALPLDSLKIDRSFIAQLRAGQPGMVVRSIVALAQGLDLKVVAEGIETEEQLGLLKELSCTYGQGYLLARPLGPADLEAGLLKQNLRMPGGHDPDGFLPRNLTN